MMEVPKIVDNNNDGDGSGGSGRITDNDNHECMLVSPMPSTV